MGRHVGDIWEGNPISLELMDLTSGLSKGSQLRRGIHVMHIWHADVDVEVLAYKICHLEMLRKLMLGVDCTVARARCCALGVGGDGATMRVEEEQGGVELLAVEVEGSLVVVPSSLSRSLW